MGHGSFPHLFQAGQIGRVETKNRIVMLPMARQFQGVNGEVTQRTIDYYRERARGGVGLIVVGSTRVFPPGHRFHTPASLNLCDDRYLGGHCELVEAIHAYGAKAAIQFGHIGGQTVHENVAASDVQQLFCDGTQYRTPRPITRSEIYDVIAWFGQGAQRARTAGYDMVEIHGAHGYLLGGFLSRKYNRRTDEFGGSLENRARILVKLVEEIKGAAGEDFAVSVRISADDYIEGSIELGESCQVAKLLDEAGADVISVSAGNHETQHLSNDIMRLEEGFKRPLFAAMKAAVGVPVVAAGGYRNPGKAEEVVAEGVADFLGVGRTLLADPAWPEKARQGRVEDIRRCVSCGECLYRAGGKFIYPQGCSVNAEFGREGRWRELEPAGQKKKVLVVGGGPAGMEAARVASARGHEVTVYEQSGQLGGQLELAAAPPGKARLLWIREYLARQLEKQGVPTKLGVEVTEELIERERPDAVVVAAGATPASSAVVDTADERVMGAWEVLGGAVGAVGHKVVVLGGNMIGCEVAEFLAEQGKQVSVVKMRPGARMAEDCEPTNRRGLLDALQARGVELVTGHRVDALTEAGVKVVERETGQARELEADTVVLALGSAPRRGLQQRLRERGVTFHAIGDCRSPNNIRQAIWDGALIGRQL